MVQWLTECFHLVRKFEPRGALPGHDVFVVKTRHDDRAAVFGDPGRDLLTTFGLPVIEVNHAAICLDACHLYPGRIRWHDNYRGHTQQTRGPRNALRMIARGKSHHTRCALRRRDL